MFPRMVRNVFPFLIGLVTGIYFISLQVTGHGLTHYPGDLVDGRFCNYILENAYLFFNGTQRYFWGAPFMYPEINVISYSDNLLGTAPFYSAFRIAGCDREAAYQYWFLLISALNYTTAYFFLNYLFKNRYAAVLGAMVFAFSIALQSQTSHAQTFPRFAIPLAFMTGLMFMQSLRPLYFFACLFFVVYQIYCGIYLGFMLMVPIALFFLISFFYKRKLYMEHMKSFRWWILMGLALLINIGILWPLLKPYMARANEIGLYPYEHISKSLLTPMSYLFSGSGTVLWDFLSGLCKNYEGYCDYQVFAGIIATLGLLIFAGIVVAKLISKNAFQKIELNVHVIMLFFTSVLTFIFFIKIGDFSFYKILYYLPGFASMRALQRIINIELIFYGIGVAFVLSLLFRNENRRTYLAFLAAVGFFVVDNYLRKDYVHHVEVAESKSRINPLIEKMKKIPAGMIVSYEPDKIGSDINDFQLDAMLAAQTLHLKTLNGYTSTSPAGYSEYWVRPAPDSREHWLKVKGVPSESIAVIH